MGVIARKREKHGFPSRFAVRITRARNRKISGNMTCKWEKSFPERGVELAGGRGGSRSTGPELSHSSAMVPALLQRLCGLDQFDELFAESPGIFAESRFSDLLDGGERPLPCVRAVA
ncbi:hypothetical protein FF011L_05830 [Roseimaritima multifibrata]|uniref:Uncharacterized protein n=1 Tax=Roseimaritima multifibrata TaxID=1930274 RepID=A0A517MAN6_9BACT|nr:hypothetical protein FF011L_05830 [Roseimaritima multifibrata]